LRTVSSQLAYSVDHSQDFPMSFNSLQPSEDINIVVPQTIAFVDAGIYDPYSIVAGLKSDIKVILDPSQDGIAQITEILTQYRNLETVTVISHGSAGNLVLGGSLLDQDSLGLYADEIQRWKQSLSTDADILLGGCNVATGEAGQAFIQNFSELTGADIAASTDLTGSSALGGDWMLEYNTGAIESSSPFLSSLVDSYQGVLVFLSDLTPTSATNGWGPYERDRSNGEQLAGDGRVLTLNGLTYTKGLGVHAASDITYALGGNYTAFTADIGIDDEVVGTNGSVIFQVWADGVRLFTSGVMTGASATQSVNVDITGRQALRLVVTDSGNGNGNDHANWANARLAAVPAGPDTSAPTATATLTNVTTAGTAPYDFTVTYSDRTAVSLNTIDNNDVRVTGPNGFSQLARLVNVTPSINGTSLTATYQITAPDGIWNWNDRGTYDVTLLGGAVQDTLGNTTTANTSLGNFNVEVSSTIVVGVNSSQVTEGGTVAIPIRRVGDTTGSATINYFTGGNTTGRPNVNYVPIPVSTLTFLPGEAEKLIPVQTLNDGAPGTNVTVSLLIETPTGADLGPSRTSSITIQDISAPSDPIFTYISDLTPTSSLNGWGPIERDRSNGEQAAGDGGVLTLNGTTYAKGLGVHAASEVTYNLGGKYNSFFAYIGVNDNVGSRGSVVFQIWADGVQLFDSGVMTGVSPTQLANVNVTSRQTLRLVVTGAGDGIDYDHANWADARLVVGQYTPPPPPPPTPTGNFVREGLISGVSQPTTIEWSPDGRLMFIAQKEGTVRLYVNNVTPPAGLTPGLQATPFISIASQVNNVSDRGLLGMTLHPDFGRGLGRDYVYLLFTYDPPEASTGSGLAARDQIGNRPARLIRVTANPSTNFTTAIAGSEVILLGSNSLWQYTSNPGIDSTDNFSILPSGIANGSNIQPPSGLIEDPDAANLGRDYSVTDTDFQNNNNIRDYIAGDSQSHTIGQVLFGPDGFLYVTVGDGTSYNGVDWRSNRVQDVDNLSGKILRIDPLTGQGVSSNPFWNGNANSNRSKVYALGLRNPFRFTFDPVTGTPYVGDVGWTTWEEINRVTPGGNYGWPYFEGPGPNTGYSALPQAQGFTGSIAPLLSRNHSASLNSDGRPTTALIMGDIYSGSTFPSRYSRAVFYSDVGLGYIYVSFLNPDGTVASTELFDDSLQYIVDMETGPDGSLYYVSLIGGEIGRWRPA
jgi:glucose/arabinose dehydrogenase